MSRGALLTQHPSDLSRHFSCPYWYFMETELQWIFFKQETLTNRLSISALKLFPWAMLFFLWLWAGRPSGNTFNNIFKAVFWCKITLLTSNIPQMRYPILSKRWGGGHISLFSFSRIHQIEFPAGSSLSWWGNHHRKPCLADKLSQHAHGQRLRQKWCCEQIVLMKRQHSSFVFKHIHKLQTLSFLLRQTCTSVSKVMPPELQKQ